MVFVASPARADHLNNDYFDNTQGETWGQAQLFDGCATSEFDDALNATELNNFSGAMGAAIMEWKDSTQFDNAFAWTTQCGGGEGWSARDAMVQHGVLSGGMTQAEHNAFCNDVAEAHPNNTVHYENDLGAGFAAAVSCDTNDNGNIDWWVMFVDSFWDGSFKWHGTPTANQWIDFRGVATHEIGHAVGFTGHIGGHCNHNNAINTMCNGSYGEEYQFGGTLRRTLENEEIAETNVDY